MRALVTGGTGFVGSHVARTLAAAGHDVRVLHRASSRLDALAGVAYESALGDINDLNALIAACEGCDWVFHVAAVADYWRSSHDKMFEANVGGVARVLQAARETGVSRVIFTSSAAAVGMRADGTPSDENDMFNMPPERFPYGYSKVLAERVVAEAVAAGQDVVTVNPVVILGPGDLNRISGDFVIRVKRMSWTIPVPSGGIAVTDVRDVARWHLAAAERGRTGERYILTTENIPYHRWFAMIARVVGVRAPAMPLPAELVPLIAEGIEIANRFGVRLPVDADQTRLGSQRIYFDGRKAWSELGGPTVPMEQSIQDTFLWYNENGYMEEDWFSRMVGSV